MASKISMSVEEYLQTSFKDGDRDYVDGEVSERKVPELKSSVTIGYLVARLMNYTDRAGTSWIPRLDAIPAVRLRINPQRYRVIDLGVWTDVEPSWGYAMRQGARVADRPPLLAVEVLGSTAQFTRGLLLVSEYLATGVETVWAIDPVDRCAIQFNSEHPEGKIVDVLRTANPKIKIPLAYVLPMFA